MHEYIHDILGYVYSRPKISGRFVVQPTINANTGLKFNWLFMLVHDLFDNLSSNVLGQDILKFVRMSAFRTSNIVAWIKSRISAKQRLNNRPMRFIDRRSLDSIKPFTLNYLNLMIHFPTNASGTEMRICKLALGNRYANSYNFLCFRIRWRECKQPRIWNPFCAQIRCFNESKEFGSSLYVA